MLYGLSFSSGNLVPPLIQIIYRPFLFPNLNKIIYSWYSQCSRFNRKTSAMKHLLFTLLASVLFFTSFAQTLTALPSGGNKKRLLVNASASLMLLYNTTAPPLKAAKERSGDSWSIPALLTRDLAAASLHPGVPAPMKIPPSSFQTMWWLKASR